MPSKPNKKMRIICQDNEIVETDVHGEFRMLAVTDAMPITRLFGYTVTHRVLGVKLRTFPSLQMALDAAKAWSVFDWEIDLKDKPQIDALSKLMKATDHWEKGS